jgi:hypothetical protein
MDRMVLKTFHALTGAEYGCWKRKNTAQELKGCDASLRADLKSKCREDGLKNAGEFQIQKRGFNTYADFAGAKKAKPT